ncbi:MAG: DUF6596 domain-containing protein [Dokdonella sp.]|uniref:RNA polymerase sigma factor n=1 Tax=Dokdonella sp. TaxID=2291710 RepID=UPI00326740BE
MTLAGINPIDAARATAEAVARRSYGKLVAFLAARSRDVAAAEDALADAFAIALADWPRTGCPTNPEAWLLTVSRRKLIDRARQQDIALAAAAELQRMADTLDAAPDDATIPDHRLALMFACAHPAIDAGVRAPLMLQAVLGLDARRIAAAFLMSPAAIGKRLGRAKEKIRQAAIPFRVPARDELYGRLETVLDAVYAAFGHGWADPAGIDATRRNLADETIFLARLLVTLMPNEAECAGLLACLLHAHARRAARRDANGDYVPLTEQDTSAWDASMIEEAEAALRRASAMHQIGRYQLEAALQSAQVERRRSGKDVSRALVQLHDALAKRLDSPVAAVNRALAIADLSGAAAALEAMPDPATDSRLVGYQPYWAALADLLARNGADADAHAAYDMAIALESDDAVRRFLRRRQGLLGSVVVRSEM